MSTRDSNRDDSPKSRVLAREPEARCTAVQWDMRCVGYAVNLHGKFIAGATTAYEAWKNAEAVIEDKE